MSPNSSKISSLEIHGYLNLRVENKFFRPDPLTETLAVILPGRGYTCDMPVSIRSLQEILQAITEFANR